MSDRVIVTSGLSKAYGIPGVRIGWIVGPPPLVETCWSQHDYLTIGPNKLSDMVARVAVTAENRETLYARTRAILGDNLPIIARWAAGFGGLLEFNRPRAGAMTLVRYRSDDAEPRAVRADPRRAEHARRARHATSASKGYLRIWYGGRQEYITEGLRRIGAVLSTLRLTAGAPCWQSALAAAVSAVSPAMVEQRLLGWLSRYGLQAHLRPPGARHRRAAGARRADADDRRDARPRGQAAAGGHAGRRHGRRR